MFRSSLTHTRYTLPGYPSTSQLPTQAAFIPSTNQVFWYTASEAYTDVGMSTLCTSSGVDTCYTLKDKSGLGHHLVQATGASRPLWVSSGVNGYPVLRFDGSNDSMAVSFTFPQPTSIYLLVKVIANTGNFYGVYDGASINTMELEHANVGTMDIYAGATLANITTVTGTFYVVSTVFNGASSVIKRNNDTAVTGNAGTATPGGFTLGGTGGGGAFCSNVDVAEVIGYNVAHDTTTRDAIAASMVTRYAL